MHAALMKQDVRPGITCFWTIQNFSYFVQNNKRKFLKSALFYNRLIKLILYPRDQVDFKYISIYLRMPSDYKLECDLELSLITSDGSCLKKYDKKCFTSGGGYSIYHGKRDFITRKEVFKNKSAYLPQDTLTVCCRLYCNETDCIVTGKYFAQTQILINRRFFTWNMSLFSTNHEIEEETIYCGNSIFDLKIYFEVGTRSRVGRKVILKIAPSSLPSRCFLSCKVDVLDTKGKVHISSNDGHTFHPKPGNQVWYFPIPITKKDLLSLKKKYLQNGVLSLQCEMAVSFGEVTVKCDEIQMLPNISEPKKAYENVNISEEFKSLKDSIICIYKDQKFIDAEIQTTDKTFHVHRLILSARSPVFSSMFKEAALKEGKTWVVEIPDVDASIMEQMLQFVYTDTVGDIDWAQTCFLYCVADKYNIQGLRKKCLSILESKLKVSNVCNVLPLTKFFPSHNDLRKIMRDFILAHDEEILRSEEWASLEKTSPQVTAQLLRHVYLEKLKNTK